MRALILPLLLLAAPAAQAAGSIVVVMPFDSSAAGVSRAEAMLLDNTIRAIGGQVLSPMGYTVLDEEGTLRLLEDNDISEEKACDASCALEAGRELNATLVITGVVSRVEGTYLVDISVMDRSGAQLGAVDASGRTLLQLAEGIRAVGGGLFTRVPRLDSKLTQERVRVRFDSSPPGAQVRVDGSVVCQRAPCDPNVAAGVREVTLELAGRLPWKRLVELSAGANVTATLGLAEGEVGAGRFVVGRDVFFDKLTGREWQRNPFEPLTRSQALEQCERLPLSGGRWRLPRAAELSTLVALRHDAAGPFVLPEAEEHTLWSASLDTVDPDLGVAMRLEEGGRTSALQRARHGVRCVRDGPSPRFRVDAAEAVDERTGLIWMRRAAWIPRERAAAHCSAGGGDGRLPTLAELETLTAPAFSPALDPEVFEDPPDEPYLAADGETFRYSAQASHGEAWVRCVRTTGWSMRGASRTFVARAGAGTHLGIVGLGFEAAVAEIRLPSGGWWQLRVAMGSGTHLVSGGLSFTRERGGLYVDLHGAWQRLGFVGRSLAPGFGVGVTAGYELRPEALPALGVKLGTGVGWSSANDGLLKPLLLDLSLGWHL